MTHQREVEIPIFPNETNSFFTPKKQIWVNKETGEEIEGYLSVKRTERSNFEIVYFSYLFDLFDKLGGKRLKILKYILENKGYDNVLVITVRELAKITNTSTYTVNQTLKILKEAKIINARTGAIIVNSKFTVKGSKAKEEWIFQKFEIFDKEKF